jgi:hypothetical protein
VPPDRQELPLCLHQPRNVLSDRHDFLPHGNFVALVTLTQDKRFLSLAVVYEQLMKDSDPL